MRRIHFDVTDSTNDEARRLAAVHPGETLLVTAAEQTAGRGRRGRRWQSPRGGAWLSLVHPLRRPAAAYAAASLAAAAAVHRAILRVAPETAPELRIKWPNDLLLSGRKIAGILCEQLTSKRATDEAPPPAPAFLIVGVGMNVDFDVDELPAELRHPATTLRAAVNRSISVNAVIDAVAEELVAALTAFETDGLSESLLAAVRANLADVGAMRTWTSPAGPITGRILGLDAAGCLLLDGPNGVVACITGEACAQT